jgi:hypothetical protein
MVPGTLTLADGLWRPHAGDRQPTEVGTHHDCCRTAVCDDDPSGLLGNLPVLGNLPGLGGIL